MKLSVVIPAYNEEENIEVAVMDVVEKWPEAEIIVVDDASTDNTFETLGDLCYSVPQLKIMWNEENMGHGYTVIKGLRAAQGDLVLYIDADRQITLTSLPIGADFISGWRIHRNDKPFRKVISFCLKMTNLFRYGIYIRDANCPYKVYRRKPLREMLKLLPETYIIPIACLEVLARRNGLDCETIATPHHPYNGVRKGFLQSFNPQMYKFLWSAFKEITSL